MPRLQDLHQLLEQAEGTGVNVYTHGEMLPAHGYPGLKKFSHLAGNFGNSWWRQQKDFAEFPVSEGEERPRTARMGCRLVAHPHVPAGVQCSTQAQP